MRRQQLGLYVFHYVCHYVTWILAHILPHGGITFKLCYNSVHKSNPFSPLFYPHRSEFLAPFHTMWPRIDNQNILKPG